MTGVYARAAYVVLWLDLVLTEMLSPVFIQHLPSGDVTFPTDHCNHCRGDKLDICLSSRVECSLNDPVEMLWSHTKDCDGPPNRISSVPSDFITCPGPDHYSPMNIDLDRFNSKLQKEYPDLFPDNATSESAILEYRRMLILNQMYPEMPVVPSKLVDRVWHAHILDTVRYHRDCLRMFGRYIHHAPSFGGEDEKIKLRADHNVMLEKYENHFRETAPNDIWPKPKSQGALPDCCSFFCVKPDCAQCVGCSADDCGVLKKAKSNVLLSPSQFGGYVPNVMSNIPDEVPIVYDFKVSPSGVPGMLIQWSIKGDSIQFSHQLADVEAWYGIGISGKEPYGMGGSDYMVSMHNKNYTGVFDLYKYDAGGGYPCWDILYQCSVGNTTKGTHDIVQPVIKRDSGLTVSTWSRKLDTGDNKDWPIIKSDMTVLFARGTNDWFDFHMNNKQMCKINFYLGNSTC